MSIFSELRRRNVIRMAGLYLVGAWLIAQVAETLLPIFDTPGWVLKVLIVLLALGFLPALVFAWVFELTPEGIKRDTEVSADASIAPQTGRRMDRMLMVVMAVALGYFAFDKFILKNDVMSIPVAATAGDQAPAPAASDAPTVAAQQDTSIAVLPFVNMSSDPEQEFFSDGLSEELLNQLAQIPQLRVIARTSSFSFKGKDVDVATIAKALDVANVLEGSVRRSGDTLRITAQLIRASDSSHLWSKTYDRKLTDVFAVQDEIANDVVSALKITLLPGQTVPKTQRTDSVEAFEHFLRGTDVIGRGQVTNGDLAAVELRQAIAIDPGYANAWAYLSIAESSLAEAAQSLDERRVFIDKAKASAEKAIELAPDLADGYAARSGIRFNYELDWEGALADARRAVELSPNDANWLTGHSYILALLGGFDQAKAESLKAVAINPLSAFAQESLGMIYVFDGSLDEARAAFARAIVLEPNTNWANYSLGYLELQAGQLDAASAAFRRADGGFPPAGQAMVEHSRGNAAASEEALDKLKEEFGAGFAFQVASVYAWRGENDKAFEWLDTALENRDAGMARLRVDVTLRSLHDDPRFAELEKRVGFPE